MTDLCGKKCLVFSPYGTTVHYGEAIKAELVRRGAIVKGYDERPSQGTFSKILIIQNLVPCTQHISIIMITHMKTPTTVV